MKIVKFSYIKGDPARWGEFERQSPGGQGIWGDYQFVFNQDIKECDYWVVFDQIPKTETCCCPKRNTLFITAEPPHIGVYPIGFLSQFHNVIACDPDIWCTKTQYANVFTEPQCPPWLVNKTYDELINMGKLEKPKLMSLITSNKDKKRYDAAIIFKDHFGNRLDLFGDGINPVKDKWDALAPYKYSIVMENEKTNYYFTEKLIDCYLAQTYPFYYGCKDLKTYRKRWNSNEGHFKDSTFTEIDINDIDLAIKKIEGVLSLKDHNLTELESSRKKCLNYYNMFALVTRIIEENGFCFNNHTIKKKESITISDKERFIKDKTMFLKKLRWRLSQWVN